MSFIAHRQTKTVSDRLPGFHAEGIVARTEDRRRLDWLRSRGALRQTPVIAFACVAGLASSPASSQTAFDGLRLGAELAYSSTHLRVDTRKPVEAALSDGRSSLADGEAAYAAGRNQLAAAQSGYAAGQADLSRAQDQLSAMLRQPAPISPAQAALRAAAVAQMRAGIDAASSALQQQAVAIDSGSRALAAGQVRLDAGRAQLAAAEAMPRVTTASMNGTTFRISAGGGTSFGTVIGPVHIGMEADVAPGRGSMIVRVPTQRDTRVESDVTMGVSARLGWVPVPWAMPFLSVGAEAMHWSISRGGSSQGRWLGGVRVGGGVEFAVAERTLLRLAYDHTYVPEVTFAGARVRPSVDTFRVGLVRVF